MAAEKLESVVSDSLQTRTSHVLLLWASAAKVARNTSESTNPVKLLQNFYLQPTLANFTGYFVFILCY